MCSVANAEGSASLYVFIWVDRCWQSGCNITTEVLEHMWQQTAEHHASHRLHFCSQIVFFYLPAELFLNTCCWRAPAWPSSGICWKLLQSRVDLQHQAFKPALNSITITIPPSTCKWQCKRTAKVDGSERWSAGCSAALLLHRRASKSSRPPLSWVSLAALRCHWQPVIIWLLVICPTGGQINTQESWADVWLTFGTVPVLVLKAILESKVAANGRTVSGKVQPQQDCNSSINVQREPPVWPPPAGGHKMHLFCPPETSSRWLTNVWLKDVFTAFQKIRLFLHFSLVIYDFGS